MKTLLAKYNHREAFCLMKYAAEDGSEVEWIWNSRDGVTPFYVGNRAGDKMLKHVDWHLDRCIPGYQPMPCERVFVNLSSQRARQKAECCIKDLWDSSDDCSYVRETYDTKEDAVEGLLASFRVDKAPDLVEFGSLSSPLRGSAAAHGGNPQDRAASPNSDTSDPSGHK